MAVIVHVTLSGVTQEQYDAVRAACGWLDEHPVGGMAHLTWWEGADCHNVDAWQDEAAFEAFGRDRLGPAIASAGVQVEPKVELRPAHEVFLPAGLTVTA